MHSMPRIANHNFVWVGQWTLTYAFLMTGVLKLCLPAAELQGQLGIAAAATPSLLPTVGALELVAALAVVLPSTTRVLPLLSPLAATGLALLSVLGAVRPEWAGGLGLFASDLALAALAALVAWARAVTAPPSALAPLAPEEGRGEDPVEVEQVRQLVERARTRHQAQLAGRSDLPTRAPEGSGRPAPRPMLAPAAFSRLAA
jgi:hypothetical protein